jgi:glucose-1-phosphate thymidylyltransferase
LTDASIFIKTIEDRQGLKIGCIEEVAFNQGWITKKQLLVLADAIPTSYGTYLKKIATRE